MYLIGFGIDMIVGSLVSTFVIIYLIETPLNAFANRADPDETALSRAARSGSTLFA